MKRASRILQQCGNQDDKQDGLGDRSNAGMLGCSRAVVVVVGTGEGLGTSIARRFSREGFKLCLLRRKLAAPLRALQEELRRESEVHIFACDARDEAAIKELFAHIENDIGPIELLCFNIGANVRFEVADTSARVFRKVWEMACFAGFLCAKEAAVYMRERERGTIIFTGATASIRGACGFSAFSSAKAALRNLAQSLAKELAPRGIHVCHVVIDGAIDTPWVRKIAPHLSTEQRMRPDAIADVYHSLYRQHPSTWTFELDLRPFSEKW